MPNPDIFDELAKGYEAAKTPQPSAAAPPVRPRSANPYDHFIEESSARNGVDPNLIRAQMGQESSFNPNAKSNKNAHGLMQLIPATAARFGVKKIYDPQQNIEGGVKYMAWLLNRYKGDVPKALAGYNAGEGAVDKYGGIPPYKETQNYVKKITANYQGAGQKPVDPFANLAANYEPPAADPFETLAQNYQPDGQIAPPPTEIAPPVVPNNIPPPPDALVNLNAVRADLATRLKTVKSPGERRKIADSLKKVGASINALQTENAAKSLTSAPPAAEKPILPPPAQNPAHISAPPPTVYDKRDLSKLQPGEPFYQFEKDGKTADGMEYLGTANGKHRFRDADGDEQELDEKSGQLNPLIPFPKRLKFGEREVTRQSGDGVYADADGKKYQVAQTADGFSAAPLDDGGDNPENSKLILGEGDAQLTQSGDQTGVPAGKIRLLDKKGVKMFASPARREKDGSVTQYTLAPENPSGAKTGRSPAKSLIVPTRRGGKVSDDSTSRPAATEEDFQAYRQDQKLPDTPENRQKFTALLADSENQNFGKNVQIGVQTEYDRQKPLPNGTLLPNQSHTTIEVKNDRALLDTQAGRVAINLQDAPKNQDANEFAWRTAFQSLAGQYSLTDAQIENGVKYAMAHQDDLDFNRYRDYPGNASVVVTRRDINNALGKNDDEIAGSVQKSFDSQQEDAQIAQNTSNKPIGRDEFGNALTQRDVQQIRGNQAADEMRAQSDLQKRVQSPDYAAQQIAAEKLGDGTVVKDAFLSAVMPIYGVYKAGADAVETWNKIGQDVPPPSDEWVKSEMDRLQGQNGNFRSALEAEKYYQNSLWQEKALRTANQASRSFVKNLVGSSVKGVVFIGDLMEKIEPVNQFLPDGYKLGLRNAGNALDFSLRLLTAPSLDKALEDYHKNYVSSSDPLEKQQLFRAMQEFDKTIGDDPVLKGRILGSLGDAGGSALSFVALGALTPELSFTTRLGEFGLSSALSGGLGAAGTGYEEGRQSGLSEDKAKIYGVIQGLLGMTEGFGVGGSVGRLIKNPSTTRALVEGILEVAKNGVWAEGKEEFVQELVQTTGGKIALETLKDEDPSAYQKLVNALNRLPKQISDTVANEGLIAFATGGAFGGATHIGEKIVGHGEHESEDANESPASAEPIVPQTAPQAATKPAETDGQPAVGSSLSFADRESGEKISGTPEDIEQADVPGNLTENEKKIYEAIAASPNKSLSHDEIAEQTGLTFAAQVKAQHGLRNKYLLGTEGNALGDDFRYKINPVEKTDNSENKVGQTELEKTDNSENNVRQNTDGKTGAVRPRDWQQDYQSKAETELETKTEEKPAHEFSSTQVNLPTDQAKKVLDLGKKLIPEADLFEGEGREDKPHITVKFGLHDDTPEKVRQLLQNEKSFDVTLGKTSIVPASENGSDYDVVKVDVHSPELHNLNKLISDNTENTDTHPEYQPHLTLAYVKKGLGAKYVGNTSLEGQKITFSSIAFSDKNRNQTEISLTGKPIAPPAANTESVRDQNSFTRDGVKYDRQPEITETDAATGSAGSVQFADGADEPFEYRLLPAEKLQPSHLEGSRNPLHFLPEAQPKYISGKDRTAASDAIAKNPDLNKAGQSPNAYFGAPVVNSRGEAIQGNNRSEAFKKHYRMGGTAYKTQLSAKAAEFGFTPEQIAAVKNPVLVRMIKSFDEQAIKLGNYSATDLESGGTQRINPVAVSSRIPHVEKSKIIDTVFNTDGDFTLNELIRDRQAPLVKALEPHLTRTQLASMKDSSGALKPDGIKDLSNLMKQFLFEGGDVNLPIVYDEMPFKVQQGVLASLPKIFNVGQEKSLIPEIQNALTAFSTFQATGGDSFTTWANQPDMFSSAAPLDIYAPVELVLAKKLDDAQTQKEVKAIFADYHRAVTDKAATLYEPAEPGASKADAVKELFGVTYNERSDQTSDQGSESAISGTQSPLAENEQNRDDESVAEKTGAAEKLAAPPEPDEQFSTDEERSAMFDEFFDEPAAKEVPAVNDERTPDDLTVEVPDSKQSVKSDLPENVIKRSNDIKDALDFAKSDDYADQVRRGLGDAAAEFAYVARDSRLIPRPKGIEMGQTDRIQADRHKYIFSNKELSADFQKEWEIKPVVNAAIENTPENTPENTSSAAPLVNTDNTAPTDLFGNPIEPKHQEGLFGAMGGNDANSLASEKLSLENAYGKKTADYIGQLEKSADKDISKVSQVSKLDTATKGLADLFAPKDVVLKRIEGQPSDENAPEFDENLYQVSLQHFVPALEHFSGDATNPREAMRQLIAHLKGNLDLDTIQNLKPYAVRFIGDVEKGIISLNQGENTDVTDSSADLERDSKRGDGDRIRETDVSDVANGNDGSLRSSFDGITEEGQGFDGDQSLFGSRTASVGKQGDSEIQKEKPDVLGESAGDIIGDGSDFFANPELSPDGNAAEYLAENAEKPEHLTNLKEKQSAAESIATKPGDIFNIRATLPFLLKEQQNDVLIAETRFSKPENHGVLFTNGTGTGKTYSGLGVIKRFAREGKNNILIVAPSDKILTDWVSSGKNLGLEISRLENTKDGGKGIVAMTYANFAANTGLIKRRFDLIVADESHHILSNGLGEDTAALEALRAVTYHPDGGVGRAKLSLPEIWRPLDKLRKAAKEKLAEIAKTNKEMRRAKGAERDALRDEGVRLGRELHDLNEKIAPLSIEFSQKSKPIIAEHKEIAADHTNRSKTVFLSATPFAYHFSLDYAEGYLFNFSGSNNPSGTYNEPDARDNFYITNFGYRMRYNKLTRPDAEVNISQMERDFNARLSNSGAMSGRVLQLDTDYERKFHLVTSGTGNQLDAAFRDLNFNYDEFPHISSYFRKHLHSTAERRLLETLKAQSSIDLIKQDLALGRKVLIYHDFKTTAKIPNPFKLSIPQSLIDPGMNETPDERLRRDETRRELETEIAEFNRIHQEIINFDFSSITSVPDVLKAAFPDAVLFNGDVSDADKRQAVEQFQNDDSGVNMVIAQSDAAREGISFHDTTGKFQRVLYNYGLPTRPVAVIQIEGRTRRFGSVTDSIYRYFNTGTSFEQTAFATTIASRAETAENLALGERARSLKNSFISAFMDSAQHEIHAGEGKGGKAFDASTLDAPTDFDRAVGYYFGQQKKTSRNKSAEGQDYYATPEPIGLKMVEWANLLPNEKVLEPSAGHGAISRWFPESANATLVEQSPDLAAKAQMFTSGKVLTDTFENLDIHNKYDAIVMNPPYGIGGKVSTAHLAKAMTHLRDGGRIIAVLPSGGLSDKRVAELLASETAENFYQIADIKLPGATFKRAATSVMTHILVLDKHTNEKTAQNLSVGDEYDLSDAADVKDLFERIRDLDISPRIEVAKPEIAPTASPNPIFAGRGGIIPTKAEQMNQLRAAQIKTYNNSLNQPTESKSETFPVKLDAFNHTKTGEKLYVATLENRIEKEDFNSIRSIAKENGGTYSSFRGAGAIPGYHFKNEANRTAFVNAVNSADSPTLKRAEANPADDFYTVTEKPTSEVIEKAEAVRDGDRLKVNIEAQELLRRAVEGSQLRAGKIHLGDPLGETPSSGTFYTKDQTGAIIKEMRQTAKLAKNAEHADDAEYLNNLADEIAAAAESGKGTFVAAVYDSRIPHETFHQGSYLGAAAANLTRRHAAPLVLDAHPAAKATAVYLRKFPEYRALESKSPAMFAALVREETGAYITNESGLLGISDEDAADYMVKFFKSYADKNGVDSLKEFHRVGGDTYTYAKQVADAYRKNAEEVTGNNAAAESAGDAESGGRLPQQSEQNAGAAASGDDGAPQKPQNGQTKVRSLPGTLREAGIDAETDDYQVLSDPQAEAEARQMISDLGISGTLDLLKTINNPDASHAEAAFILSRTLQENADALENVGDADGAFKLRQAQADLTKNLAIQFTKAGQFISAARVVSNYATGVLIGAQAVLQHKFGEDAALPPEKIAELEALGRNAQDAQTKLAQAQKLYKNEEAENRRRRDLLDENKISTRKSKSSTFARAKVAELVRAKHGGSVSDLVKDLRAKLLAEPNLKHIAYHGSPHVFDKFSLDHIFDDADVSIEAILKRAEGEPHDEQTFKDLAKVGALNLIDGINSTDLTYTDAHFNSEMIAAFGDSVKPDLPRIYQDSLRQRDAWLKETAAEQRKTSLQNQADTNAGRGDLEKLVGRDLPEDLTDDDISEILGVRRQNAKNRNALERFHRLAANLRAKDVSVDLEKEIAAAAATPEEAYAARIFAENGSRKEFYDAMEAANISETDAQKLFVRGQDVLKAAKEKVAETAAANLQSVADHSEDFKSAENLLWEARKQMQASQSAIADEYKKLTTSKTKYVAAQIFENLMNLPRSLKATGEFSFLMRQGGYFFVSGAARALLNGAWTAGKIALGKPGTDYDIVKDFKEQGAIFAAGAKSLGSASGFGSVILAVEANPHFKEAVKMGVKFSSAGKIGTGVKTGEEQLNQPLIEKLAEQSNKFILPLAAKGMVRFDDSMAGTLDPQRMMLYDRMATQLKDEGFDPVKNREEFEEIARFVNRGTGKANDINLKFLKSAVDTVKKSRLPFAANYTVSHWQSILGDAKNLTTAVGRLIAFQELPKGAKKQALERAAYSYGSLVVLYGLMAMVVGAHVSFDPDDDDFLKFKWGKYRYDVSFGLRTELRFIAKFIASGVRGNRVPYEVAYDAINNSARYGRSKLNVLPSFALDALFGKDITGKAVDMKDWKTYASLIVPITYGTAWQNAKSDGAFGFAATIPAEFVGLSASVYDDRPDEAATPAEHLAVKIKQMRRVTFSTKVFDQKTDQETYNQLGKLRERARTGEDVSAEVEALRKAGKIDDKTAKKTLSAKDQPLFNDLLGSGQFSDNELDALYKAGNEQEKAQIDKMRGKREDGQLKKNASDNHKNAIEQTISETLQLPKTERAAAMEAKIKDLTIGKIISIADAAKIRIAVNQEKNADVLKIENAKNPENAIETFKTAALATDDKNEREKLAAAILVKKAHTKKPEVREQYAAALDWFEENKTRKSFGRASENVEDVRNTVRRPIRQTAKPANFAQRPMQ